MDKKFANLYCVPSEYEVAEALVRLEGDKIHDIGISNCQSI